MIKGEVKQHYNKKLEQYYRETIVDLNKALPKMDIVVIKALILNCNLLICDTTISEIDLEQTKKELELYKEELKKREYK